MASIGYSDALELSKKEHTCVKHITANQHIALNPKFIGHIGKGIRQQLNSQLNLYSERLEGVPIAYGQPKCRRRHASILEEQPFLHFNCEVDAIVFQPTVGSKVTGVVNKMGFDHVSCLVHGVFNAAIYKPRGTNSDWAGSQLSLRQQVTLKIAKLYIYNGVVTIRAQLLEAGSKPNLDETVICQQNVAIETTSASSTITPAKRLPANQLDTGRKKTEKKGKRKSETSTKTDSVGQDSLDASFIVNISHSRKGKGDNDSIGSFDSGLGALTPPLQLSDSQEKHKKSKKSKRKSTEVTTESEKDKSVSVIQSIDTNFIKLENDNGNQHKHKSKKKKRNESIDLTNSSLQYIVASNVHNESTVNTELSDNDSHHKRKKKKKKSREETDVELDVSNQNLIVIKPDPDYVDSKDTSSLDGVNVQTFNIYADASQAATRDNELCFTSSKKKKKRKRDSSINLNVSDVEQVSSIHKKKKKKIKLEHLD